MKYFRLVIIVGLFVLMSFPLRVEAATISNASINGVVEPKHGKNYSTAGVPAEPNLYTVEFYKWYKCTSASCATANSMSSSETYVGGDYYRVEFKIKATAGNTLSSTVAVYINGKTANKNVTGSDTYYALNFQVPHEYGLTVTPSGNYVFPTKTVGYSTFDKFTFTVQNTSTEGITIDVYSNDVSSAFEITSINYGNNTKGIKLGRGGGKITFTVTPTGKTRYTPGLYTMQIFVSTPSSIYPIFVPTQSFSVSLTVNPETYSVSVQTDGNGVATASPTSAASGSNVTLSATPKAGYTFKSWQVISGGVSISNNKFTMGSSNVVVKALFEQLPTYNVTVNSGSANKTKPMAGEVVTISANAAPSGKVFDKWTTSDGITFANASNAVTTFTMPAKNVTVKATYKDLPAGSYAINIQTDGGGIAKASADHAKSGTGITLSATPNAGYKFVSWQVMSGGVTIKDNKFTIGSSSVTIKAIFEKLSYTITINNGTSNVKSAQIGEEVTITANTPFLGKMFDEWTSSNNTVIFADEGAMSTTFIMVASDVTIEATYKDLPEGTYAINILNDGNGTAEANVLYAVPGEEITLTTSASEGYHFVKWVVTGGNVTVTDNKFIMPEDNVTIEAVFAKNTEDTDVKAKEKNGFSWWWTLLGIPLIGGLFFARLKLREKKAAINKKSSN